MHVDCSNVVSQAIQEAIERSNLNECTNLKRVTDETSDDASNFQHNTSPIRLEKSFFLRGWKSFRVRQAHEFSRARDRMRSTSEMSAYKKVLEWWTHDRVRDHPSCEFRFHVDNQVTASKKVFIQVSQSAASKIRMPRIRDRDTMTSWVRLIKILLRGKISQNVPIWSNSIPAWQSSLLVKKPWIFGVHRNFLVVLFVDMLATKKCQRKTPVFGWGVTHLAITTLSATAMHRSGSELESAKFANAPSHNYNEWHQLWDWLHVKNYGKVSHTRGKNLYVLRTNSATHARGHTNLYDPLLESAVRGSGRLHPRVAHVLSPPKGYQDRSRVWV